MKARSLLPTALLTLSLLAGPAHAAKRGPAILAGLDTDWLLAMGAPNSHSSLKKGDGELHWKRCGGSNTDQWIVTFIAHRADSIMRQYCSQGDTPGASIRQAEAQRFYPPQAMLKSKVSTDDGVEYYYVSAWLARTLPNFPSYVDHDGNPAPVGTFSFAPGVTADQGWNLCVGSCQ
jgi:hypothetical protein